MGAGVEEVAPAEWGRKRTKSSPAHGIGQHTVEATRRASVRTSKPSYGSNLHQRRCNDLLFISLPRSQSVLLLREPVGLPG